MIFSKQKQLQGRDFTRRSKREIASRHSCVRTRRDGLHPRSLERHHRKREYQLAVVVFDRHTEFLAMEVAELGDGGRLLWPVGDVLRDALSEKARREQVHRFDWVGRAALGGFVDAEFVAT